MEQRYKGCGSIKDRSEFPKAGIVNGVQYYRRKCTQCYSKQKGNERRVRKDKFYDYKKTLSCARCGNNDHRVLDFHHLNPLEKDFDIGYMLSKGYSIDKVLLETEKCIILCANCHRIIHSTQAGSNPAIPTNTNQTYRGGYK